MVVDIAGGTRHLMPVNADAAKQRFIPQDGTSF